MNSEYHDEDLQEKIVESIKDKSTQKKKKKKLKKEVVLIALLVFSISVVLVVQSKAAANKEKVVDDTVYTALEFDEPMKQVLKILTLKAEEHEKLFNNDKSTIEYSDIKNYEEEKLQRYIDFHNLHPELLHAEVIWRVNSDLDYDAYTLGAYVADPNDILVTVNKSYGIESAYVPSDLVEMDTIDDEFYLREEAHQMFKEMQEALAKKELKIGVDKAYANYQTLSQEYEAYVAEHGEDKALVDSVKPGHSEFQLGLALRVNDTQSDSSKFHETDTYHWLKLNAHRFGFIFRYEAAQDVTGYPKASNHLRYVGKDTAVDMYEKNISVLEEYIDKHGNK